MVTNFNELCELKEAYIIFCSSNSLVLIVKDTLIRVITMRLQSELVD